MVVPSRYCLATAAKSVTKRSRKKPWNSMLMTWVWLKKIVHVVVIAMCVIVSAVVVTSLSASVAGVIAVVKNRKSAAVAVIVTSVKNLPAAAMKMVVVL
ncbi:hypothetical protein D3C71_1602850 [compost metagenome]